MSKFKTARRILLGATETLLVRIRNTIGLADSLPAMLRIALQAGWMPE
jgi:hypothetical protein